MEPNALERACIDAFRAGEDPHFGSPLDSEAWIAFGVHTLLEAGRKVRALRLSSGDSRLDFKHDGSPATEAEREIEASLRRRLERFAPDATVLGEESGGRVASAGDAIAIDPIDGTWAFLGRTETFCTALTLFREGVPTLGFIGSPATGDVAYASRGGIARLLQLSTFGEGDVGLDLPLPRVGSTGPLVNVHPAATTGSVVSALYEAWRERGVRMVRSPGGSPSWALLEAAKGTFTYVNMWSARPAQPYDLAAGTLMVLGAGGAVVDLRGDPIDPVGHAGPFVAGVDPEARSAILGLVRDVAARAR